MKTLKLKHSFLLAHNERIECLQASNKVLATASERGDVTLRNLYSDEIFQVI
jgi:hypothetical protein